MKWNAYQGRFLLRHLKWLRLKVAHHFSWIWCPLYAKCLFFLSFCFVTVVHVCEPLATSTCSGFWNLKLYSLRVVMKTAALKREPIITEGQKCSLPVWSLVDVIYVPRSCGKLQTLKFCSVDFSLWADTPFSFSELKLRMLHACRIVIHPTSLSKTWTSCLYHSLGSLLYSKGTKKKVIFKHDFEMLRKMPWS